MYQLEVKRALVEHHFRPEDGWEVTVDIDSMERGHGDQHPPDKREAVEVAENWLRRHGVKIGSHPEFGRADVVAAKKGQPRWIVEVEGEAKRQKEQAMYSALGQTITMMREAADTRYALAVPDIPAWERQVEKIPIHIRSMLKLDIWLVSSRSVRSMNGES